MLLTPTRNSHGETYFPEINGQAFERQDSYSIFERVFSESLGEESRLYLILGTDSGLLVDYVRKNCLGKKSRFVFVDYPEVIERIEEQFWDLEDSIRLEPYPYAFEQLAIFYEDYLVRNTYSLIQSLAAIDKMAGYADMWKEFEADFYAFHFSNSAGLNSRQFTDMQLRVLPDLIHPISRLKDSFTGKTALLLGGGPSLDGVIDWVKQQRNALIVFSAARITQRLLNEGIRPDFVVSVDPHDVSFDNSKAMLKLDSDTILLSSYHPNERLIKQWPYAMAFAGQMMPWVDSSFPSDNPDAPGPTVMNSAFFFAVYLGVKHVYVAGMDFCFSTTGQSHESGSQEATAGVGVDPKSITAKVLTYAGDYAQTSTDFLRAKETFEYQVETYQKASKAALSVFNLCDSAAVVKGVEFLSSEKATRLLGANDIATSKRNAQTLLTESLPERAQRLQAQKKSIQKISQLLAKVQAECKGAYKFDAGLHPKINVAVANTQLAKLKNKVADLLSPNDDLLFAYSPSDFHDFLKPIDKSDVGFTSEEINQSLCSYLKGCNEAANKLKETLIDRLSDFSVPLEEIRPYESKRFQTLANEWQAAQVPGRVYAWLNWHEMRRDSLAQLEPLLLEQLEGAFEAQFSATAKNTLKERFEARKQDPVYYLNLIDKAYEQPSVVWLESIELELRERLSEDFMALHGYATALLSLLKNDQETAVRAFESIKHPKLLFTVLKRLLTLHLDARNYEKTLEVLQALIPYNDEYVVNFADLIALLGNKMDAISLYEQFVNKYTSRTDVWWKMARLLAELNEVQLVKEVCEKILTISPEHLLAKQMLAKIVPTA